MKTLIKLIAVAAAFGLSPASALAQDNAAIAPNDTLVAQPQLAPVESPATANAAAPAADAAATPAVATERAAPVEGIGQPDGRMGLQDQFSPVGEDAAWFHDLVLMPVITAISILVLLLMLYVIVRFRRAANPTPSRTTHNTLIEVIWTLVPVIILVIIAVPSIKLLAHQYSPPKADLTVKAIGNQWYWSYQYPDNGDFEIVSNMLTDEEAKAKGEPRLLGVDERMVVPVGATVKLIVTSNDVLHSFALPAFWVKMDAVPGRLNETWFKTERPGVYYGQCSELCGARHGFMPIAVEVVSKEQYAAWVASKGGTMPGQAPAEAAPAEAAPAAPEAAPATAPAPASAT
ncbi:cytochrome c oxidase subunit II [Allosphingosinicella humi]